VRGSGVCLALMVDLVNGVGLRDCI
jgi:hypothetical protein